MTTADVATAAPALRGLSGAERDRRYRAVRAIMAREGLDALLVPGPSLPMAYLANARTLAAPGLVVFFPGDPTVLVSPHPMAGYGARESWLAERRLNLNPGAEAAVCVQERAPAARRVGVCRQDLLPVPWHRAITSGLPDVELVSVDRAFLELVLIKSDEEMALMRGASAAADAALADLMGFLRPGLNEYEIAGRLEWHPRSHGADQVVTLVTTRALEEYCYLPTDRVARPGDVLSVEVSPQVQGYWSHVARMVTLGPASDEVKRLHDLCLRAKAAALEGIKPGLPVADAMRAMEAVVEAGGFHLWWNDAGHFIGVDMGESWANRETEFVFQPNMTLAVHPIIYYGEGGLVLNGEMYRVTETGCEALNHSSDELVVLT